MTPRPTARVATVLPPAVALTGVAAWIDRRTR